MGFNSMIIFVLLLTIFVLITAGVSSTLTVYKNLVRDTLKILKIGEIKLNNQLEKQKELRNYTVHQ